MVVLEIKTGDSVAAAVDGLLYLLFLLRCFYLEDWMVVPHKILLERNLLVFCCRAILGLSRNSSAGRFRK